MAQYLNPTGTLNATEGDDTITFNVHPGGAGTFAVVDALGGNDSLLVDIAYAGSTTFEVSDIFNTGTLQGRVQFGPYDGQLLVYNVENVDFRGTANNDFFKLNLGSSGSGLSVNLNGQSGFDELKFDWSKFTTGISFVVAGSTITSSWGAFANFERFELRAGSGNDTIVTGDGNDNIYTGTGVDTVDAGAGNDYIYSESSGGTIDGGAGHDSYGANFSAALAPLSITIGTTIQISNGITVSNTESFGIGGGSGDDLFTVNGAPNGGAVYGGGGYDTLTYNLVPTSALQLSIEAFSGNQLSGNIGPLGSQLSFNQFESVSITGSQLNDSFLVWGAYSGSGLSFNGGAGTDLLTLDFANSTSAMSFVVSPDGAVSSSLGAFVSFETFVLSGGQGGDTLFSGSGNDTLSGGRGSDQLDGGAGDDVLNNGNVYHDDDGAVDALAGGSGNDTIYAGIGDNVDGGSGNDRLHLDARAATAGITADFSQLTNGGTITVGGGNLTGIESLGAINATNFADNIVAGSTGSGAQMFGWDGDDRLQGSSAADSIYGGNGNDIVTGGLGQDTFVDDRGEDTFLDTAAGLNGDTIVGLSIGDKIIITDADPGSFTFQLSGNALTYSGGTLYLNSELPGRIVASAAAGGGVQLEVQLPPLATNDQIASQLTSGYWNGDVHRWNVTQGGTLSVNISMLSSAEQAVARAALASWAEIIGIQFQEVSSGGQIVFDNSYDPGQGPHAITNWSDGMMTSAVIHIPSHWITTYGSQPGSSGYETYVHEVGHALGLGHAGNYNFDASYVNDALFANDSVATTVMSYFDQSQSYYFAAQHFSNYRAATPMQADIVAVQSLYGLSTTARTGNTVYGFNTNAGPVFAASGSVALTIFDSSGNDTIDYSNVFYSQLINLNPETFSNVNGGVGNLAIARGTIIENAIGGSGADQLIGNTTGNILRGNAGIDSLTGGAGADTFQDTAAGLNGDTITDFAAGDRIVFTNATLGSFTYSLSGSTLTYAGGTLILTGVSGTLVASAAAAGGVQLTLRASIGGRAGDFNGDGLDDILWQHENGAVTNWLGQANGGMAGNIANLDVQTPAGWGVAGIGDFNGDGLDDILWQHDNGTVTNWLGQANGGMTGNLANLDVQTPAGWDIAGIGDFNGDGLDDILWQHANGTVTNWLGQANGGMTGNLANLDVQTPAGWDIAGIGDFNGDGLDDILWQHANGTVTNWLGQANGGMAGNIANLNIGTPAGWDIAGIGDFNGDGHDDILWQHDNGPMTNWLGQANGGMAGNIANLDMQTPAGWDVAGIGDFNGDGLDDILWQHANGTVTNWLGQANGGMAGNIANLDVQTPAGWEIVPGII